MAALVLPQRRMAQPSYPVGINRSNPLSRGLVCAFLPGNADYDLAAGGLPFTYLGAKQYTNGQQGRMYLSDATHGITTASNPQFTNQLSVLWAGRNDVYPPAISTGQFVNNRSTWGSNTIPFGLAIDTTPAYQFIVIGNGNVLRVTPTNLTGNVVVLGTWDGATQKLFENGIFRGSQAASGTVTNGSTPVGIGQGTSGEYTNAGHALALVWNRGLSDGEAREISNNPWQVFSQRLT